MNKFPPNLFNNILINFALIIFLFVTASPLINQVLSPYFIAFNYFFIFAILIFKFGFNDFIRFFSPFLFILSLDFALILLSDSGNFLIFIYNSIILLIPPLFYVYLKDINKHYFKFYLKLFLFLFFITNVTSIYGLILDPMASRLSATISNSKDPYAISINLRNIANFRIVYSGVLLLPSLVYIFKSKKLNLFYSLLFLSTLLMIFYSQYTIAIFLSVFSIFGFFNQKNISLNKIIVLVFSILILFTIFPPILKISLTLLIDFFEPFLKIVSLKLLDLMEFIFSNQNPENSLFSRIQVYKYSIDIFISNPLFGSIFDPSNLLILGNHSFLFDSLAKFGIFGLIGYIFYMRKIWVSFFLNILNKSNKNLLRYTYLIFVILTIINPINNLLIVALISPLMIKLLNEENSMVSK